MYPHERSLVQEFADKPFALVGVNSDTDPDKLKSRMREENITWRSFWSGDAGTRGPIPTKWNVRGWPTLFVLDHKGVIQARWLGNPGDEVVAKTLHDLVANAEKDK